MLEVCAATEASHNENLTMKRKRERHFTARKIKKGMKDHKKTESELLVEVQQKGAAFEDAYNRCGERQLGTLQQCLESFALDYRDALNAFSEFILEGRYENKPRPLVF